jgi:hypothetical protein
MTKFNYIGWLQGFGSQGNDQFPLKKGSKGQRVARVQMLLNRWGAGLTEDGVFGANTEKALSKYYDITSVENQTKFDLLYKIETLQNKASKAKENAESAKANYEKAKSNTTVTVGKETVKVPEDTQGKFDAMLKVDYSTFANLAQLGAALQTMQDKILAHAAEVKKQTALYGPYSYAAATSGAWKGKPYGLFPSLNAAADFSGKWKKGFDVYKKVKTNYDKRQAEYRNNVTLRAAKAISEVKDTVIAKAKSTFSRFKKWALSGTDESLGDGGLISGPVLIVAGIAITSLALVVMGAMVINYLKQTSIDAEDVAKAQTDIKGLIASEEKEKAELYKKAEEAKAAGDTQGAKQFTEAAVKKEETISELKKESVEIFKDQQAIDKIKEEKGGILNQLGDNAGKIATAGVALLVVGLVWQNKDSFKAKAKEKEETPEVLQEAA